MGSVKVSPLPWTQQLVLRTSVHHSVRLVSFVHPIHRLLQGNKDFRNSLELEFLAAPFTHYVPFRRSRHLSGPQLPCLQKMAETSSMEQSWWNPWSST